MIPEAGHHDEGVVVGSGIVFDQMLRNRNWRLTEDIQLPLKAGSGLETIGEHDENRARLNRHGLKPDLLSRQRARPKDERR